METSRKLRILHTNMLRGWGGQSNRILTEALGTRAAGHEVAFAVPEGSVLQRKADELGMETFRGYNFRPPAQFWRFLPEVTRFLRDLDRWRPDIIHLHGSQDTWLTMAARRKRPEGFPVTIRTKHNIVVWKPHRLNRWLYQGIDGYVSISAYIDKQVGAFPGLSRKPRALIRSVPDVQRLDVDARPIRDQIPGLQPGQFLWGTTARLRPEKGLDILLKAFAEVKKARPAAFLVIAGDGSERADLEGQARLLNLGPDALHFLGFRKDVPAVLASLDAYVLPSRSEGLGTAILEALAVGLPVVATNVGGIPDSVHHESTGLLTEPENASALAQCMLRIMDDATLRTNLGSNARRFVREEFTEKALIEKTVAFYQQMAGTPALAP
jgi:glycosyltransferase involved in cell wall biosynthesis